MNHFKDWKQKGFQTHIVEVNEEVENQENQENEGNEDEIVHETLEQGLYITVSLISIQTTEFHILSWYQITIIGDSAHTSSATSNNQPTQIPNIGDKKSSESEITISDPLTLHHSDSPGLVLVSKPLEGHNYDQWSRSMLIALSAKNKLGFIDGTIKSPASTDAKSAIWQRCNDMVLLWILQSLHPNIASSVLYCTSASMVWNDLKDRFSQSTESRIYEIRQEIAEHRQGHLTISEYYTKLKALWDELDSYHEPIICNCKGSKTRDSRGEGESYAIFNGS
ncbi:hypothetical protein L3X38_010323 [Prunus dulcis]|uniref:Retrotransposon Copia-like N-terminal domain-containing protein n=1 Tax=Prunus dulcis TaxID=3755 RepID=A0AAD4WG53_PRUDU|nr:hypothetical protein L3X38_010323 [Prunus dulcis]